MNDLPKIGLVGGGFHHSTSSTLDKKPTYFEWAKSQIVDTTFFVDDAIINGQFADCKRKFAWLVESKDIIPGVTYKIQQNHVNISQSYEFLFTHNKEIYDLADNFVFLPSHGYWIEEPQIYQKSKLVSMISSNKNWSVGHRKRLEWVEKFRNKVDLFGRGFQEISKKEEGLADYMFTICVENDSYNSYWSEKLLDCFVSGTIPVYYGSPNIGNFFNLDGIIILNDEFSIDQLTIEEYNKRHMAIIDNFYRALKYDVIEDILWEEWINKS